MANPAPGGGTSAALAFSVNDPAPAIATLVPSSALVASPDTTVTVNGSGFVAASSVLLGGAPLSATYVNSGTMTAVIPAASLATTGSPLAHRLEPGARGGRPLPATFSVNNPLPVATAAVPSFALVGAPDTQVNITGSGFLASSTVLLGGAPLATTFLNAGSLDAVIPAAELAAAAAHTLSVSNPAPGGGTSAVLGFTVDNPGPGDRADRPCVGVTVLATDTPITVTGTGFRGVSVVQIGGTPLATTFSAGSLDATIPAASLASATTPARSRSPTWRREGGRRTCPSSSPATPRLPSRPSRRRRSTRAPRPLRS